MNTFFRKTGGWTLFLGLSLLMIVSTSCSKIKLKAGVTAANKQCPISLGADVGEITSITYDDNNVVYTFTFEEDALNIPALKANPESVKSSMVIMFQNPTREVGNMLKLIVDCKAGVEVVYIAKNSGEKVSFFLKPEELKDIYENKSNKEGASHLEKLKAQVDVANLQCPMVLEEDMTIQSITLEDQGVIYHCHFDEEVYDISSFEENAESIKEELLASLSDQSNMAIQVFLACCVNADRGIIYRYTGNKSGAYYDVVLPVDELKGYIGSSPMVQSAIGQ